MKVNSEMVRVGGRIAMAATYASRYVQAHRFPFPRVPNKSQVLCGMHDSFMICEG